MNVCEVMRNDQTCLSISGSVDVTVLCRKAVYEKRMTQMNDLVVWKLDH